MSTALLLSALALLPALAAFAAYPKNWWVAASAGAGALGLSLYLAVTQSDWAWLLIGVYSGAASLYGALAVLRYLDRRDAWIGELESRRKQAEEMKERLAVLKQEGVKSEAEQKRALAMYGVVKGLAEALDFETMRPKLEAAVQQHLGLDEFALYVSDMRYEGTMHPLVKRRLVGSVGGTWDSLRSFLEGRKLALTEPQYLASPQNSIGVPVSQGEEIVGYLFARVPAQSEAKTLLERAQQFGTEIAFALKRVRLFQEVERLSEFDGLTGVYRRVIFDQRMKEETLRAKTFKTTYCVAIVDIDHFKRLNDTYGHQFGDAVLKKVGEVLRKNVYDTDFVARYGGEEFAIVMPRASAEGVLAKAEKIRQAIERESFVHGLETVRVSASIGVGHYPRDGRTPEEVIAQADRALYHAKGSGRNRVVDLFQSEHPAG